MISFVKRLKLKESMLLFRFLGLIAFGLIADVLKPVLKIEEALAAGQILTKNDMKDVIDDCYGLVNGNIFTLKCRR